MTSSRCSLGIGLLQVSKRCPEDETPSACSPPTSTSVGELVRARTPACRPLHHRCCHCHRQLMQQMSRLGAQTSTRSPAPMGPIEIAKRRQAYLRPSLRPGTQYQPDERRPGAARASARSARHRYGYLRIGRRRQRHRGSVAFEAGAPARGDPLAALTGARRRESASRSTDKIPPSSASTGGDRGARRGPPPHGCSINWRRSALHPRPTHTNGGCVMRPTCLSTCRHQVAQPWLARRPDKARLP